MSFHLVFSKGYTFVYCFLLRRYPSAAIFVVSLSTPIPDISLTSIQQDHRNDIIVNIFDLAMSIAGTKFRKVWFLDPTGAICTALLILFSWASTAFEHLWYLVGKSTPQDFLNKMVYVSITHEPRIKKIGIVSKQP
ncbi:MAG: hypothetical protein CL912_27140 [Deltaproteobacteria bacterium]|nr:hypothetical protein [Deltaproteobacteria bacterium]